MKKLEDYLYYEEKNPDLTIYLGDCLEILPLLPKVDLVVTDPPYGINLETAYRLRGRGRLAECKDYAEVIGDDKNFDPTPFLSYPNVVMFGANYYADKLPKTSGWLVWDKRENQAQNDQADGELAWTNCVKGVRICHHMWNGFLRDSERGESYHPTQKPTHLIKWIFSLRWIPNTTVLDPFLGSGTTLVACKELNRNGIGIEISEKYCEIAKKRLKATCRPLFTDANGARKYTKGNDPQKDMQLFAG
jgi:site-specific DNA-methyltransferase (adenine-specific)